MAFFFFVKHLLVITVYAVLRALVEANKASIWTSFRALVEDNKASIWTSFACGAGAGMFIASGLKFETSLIILMGLQLVGVTVLEVVARWLWDAVFNAKKKKASKEYEIKNNQNESMDLDEQEIDKGADLFIAKFYDAERWHADGMMIDLSNNELSNLPDEPPKCPKLIILHLQKNYKLRKIPPAFFTNMPLLKFLDLSETGIMSLPKSLFELPLLSKLYLMECEFLMVLPPEVGKLKHLEELLMEGTEIINLPIEIKELSGLRRLRVSLYGCLDHDGENSSQSNEIIHSGVISALSNLEDVSIDVNPDDERWDTCVERILNEVCGLTKLRYLGFYFPRVELLSCLMPDHASVIHQLKHFKLIVGGHSKRIISRLPSNVELELNTRYECLLKYINGEGVPEVIKKVLQKATMFHLDRHMTARKLTEFVIENMNHSLQYCVLSECNEMQVIIDGNDIQIGCESSGDRRIGLESLMSLYIYYMKNLKSIWEGPTHKKCLSGLKSLTLSTCPQLTTIFTVGLLESLRNLEELTVRDCPAIKSLVSCEEGDKQSANYLLELRTISLHYVPNLVSISSEVRIAPKLKSLSLYNCPKLKSLSIKEVSSKHLTKITGETDWWEALELTQVQRDKFDGIFASINADTLDNGPIGKPKDSLSKAQLQQSVDLDEKEQRFIEKKIQASGPGGQPDPTSGEGPSSSSAPPPPTTTAAEGSSTAAAPLSRFENQKRRDWNTFLQYLKNHKPPLTLAQCSGAHVIEFLNYLDQFGKTKVHVSGCLYFGHSNPPVPCVCPLKQAWGSLNALIGRLRAAYEENGGQPKSNPFGARAVRIYLREVREGQAKARGIPYEKKN